MLCCFSKHLLPALAVRKVESGLCIVLGHTSQASSLAYAVFSLSPQWLSKAVCLGVLRAPVYS